MKLLIVEDNPDVRHLLRRLLGDLATEFAECADGGLALNAYAALQPDWVLMDLALGQVDGLLATRLVCAAYPDAKIIIVTSHDNATLRQAAFQAGARAYVNKENLFELRRLLRNPDSGL